MARTVKTFRKTDRWGGFDAEAYTDDEKVWRWVSNNAPCPMDACDEYGIPADAEAQRKALDDHYDEVVRAYRKRMENHEPDAEEMYEMRAAFGEGTTVVNVITGKETKL